MPDLLDVGGISPGMRKRLEEVFTIHPLEDYPADRITHVITNGGVGIDNDLMAALPQLKMIASTGVGYDVIDAAEAARRGIVVTHTPGALNGEVATTAVMLMLACYRALLRDDRWVREGMWAANGAPPLTRSPDGQVVGILGLGRIGEEIARRLGPWAPTILYHNRTPKDVPYRYCDDLLEMAAACDTLICAAPGGEGTQHLVDADVLAALGPEGTLINVGRGSVVDEAALVSALQTGKLGWAGLDVFEDEPNVPRALCEMPNVVLMPHAGSATTETRRAMVRLTAENLLQHHRDGTVLTPVPECAHL